MNTPRVYKYRGYTTEEGKWIYGSLINVHGDDKIFIRELQPDKEENGKHLTYLVVPQSVGQYTERQDIDGNELYEGDDVNLLYETEDSTSIYRVVFYSGSWKVALIKNDEVDYTICWPLSLATQEEMVKLIGPSYNHNR